MQESIMENKPLQRRWKRALGVILALTVLAVGGIFLATGRLAREQIPSSQMIDLAGGWQQLGVKQVTKAYEMTPCLFPQERTFVLSPAQAQSQNAWLEIDIAPTAVELFLNDARLGTFSGDLRNGRFSVSGLMAPGDNRLAMIPLKDGDADAPLAKLPPAGNLAQLPPAIRLVLAPKAYLSALIIEPSDVVGVVTLSATAELPPDGASIVLSLIQDGVSLATARTTLKANRAGATFQLDSDQLWSPLEGRINLLWGVASLYNAAGELLDTRAQRIAPGSVAWSRDALKISGVDARLWGIKFDHRGDDIRAILPHLARRMNRAGLNTLETHGWVPDPQMVEVAEELGLFLVVLPRCPGQLRIPMGQGLPSTAAPALAEAMVGAVRTLEQSPTVVMWERETAWMQIPQAKRPVATGGAPANNALHVPVVGASATTRLTPEGVEEETVHLDGGNSLGGRRWIIEITPENPKIHQLVAPEALSRFLLEWRASGALGLVLPPVQGGTFLRTLSNENLDILARGRHADVPKSSPLRGPAGVWARVTQDGLPRSGVQVQLQVDGLPAWIAATDRSGVARFLVWWSGTGTVTAEGVSSSVALSPGRYADGGWHPSVSEVSLETGQSAPAIKNGSHPAESQ